MEKQCEVSSDSPAATAAKTTEEREKEEEEEKQNDIKSFSKILDEITKNTAATAEGAASAEVSKDATN